MNCSSAPNSRWGRIISVWYRHVRVYSSNLLSNVFPSFLEPLILLAGLGIGLGAYLPSMGSLSYLAFLASGVIVTGSMFAASYECTYGTFVRLEFDKVYDGMLSAPLSPGDLVLGEILFVGTKGFLFALAVLVVIWAAGIISYPLSFLATLSGFLCGLMFGALSMLVTTRIKNINHFNFYFTGLISPMFFFSGVVFPVENLSPALRLLAEALPLTHVVRLARAFCFPGQLGPILLLDLLYCAAAIVVFSWLAERGLKKRMIL